jgi:hypothetical protein
MAKARKKTVFVSHISDETELAQWLKTRLVRDFLGAVNVFVSSDRATIGAGSKWLEEVGTALRQADLQVVLCSRQSVGRPWVNFEAGAVWLRDIPVVPLCHSGLEPAELPVPLSMLEGVAFGDAAGLAKLYDAVAAAVGLDAPSLDYDALAGEARALEAKNALAVRNVDVVENPRVLCAASVQYAEPQYGFDLDIEILQRYFPGQVTVEPALTSVRLMDLLTSGRFDIIHLVMPIDPETGALIFSRVDYESQLPLVPAETMPAASFAALLTEAGARLVVLATCKALLLAVEVATVANMAASDQDITGQEAAAWEGCFYRLLAQGKSVHKAFDITKQHSNTPIRAVRQKDVLFVTKAPV